MSNGCNKKKKVDTWHEPGVQWHLRPMNVLFCFVLLGKVYRRWPDLFIARGSRIISLVACYLSYLVTVMHCTLVSYCLCYWCIQREFLDASLSIQQGYLLNA